MSIHNPNIKETERIVELKIPMIIRQARKNDNLILKLTSPLIIKNFEATFDENRLKIDSGTNPKADKKYKSAIKTEDEKLDSKKNRIKQKRKNRNKLYLNEEESFHEIKSSYEKFDKSPSLSISTARPPRPSEYESIEIKNSNKKIKKRSNYSNNKKQQTNQTIQTITTPSEIRLDGAISIQNLSELTQISHEEIIKFLFLQGTIVNINQVIDLETATLVLENFNIKINNNIEVEEEESLLNKNKHSNHQNDNHLTNRHPVVTIMGHVDHGKTTLLDAIISSNKKITNSEAGGITQNIGVYEVCIDHNSQERKITFLDTPGHEAFMAMRARGAKLADIAILIIAADDGIKKQTEEALKYIKESNLAMIVAITKIDKETANPESIKEKLATYDIISEDLGGETPVVLISAKSGKNLSKLIDNIILLAEIQDLKANNNKPAEGTIIESYIDKTQGHVATIIVREGKLKIGDVIVCEGVIGKIRSMTDTKKEKLLTCGPSSVVQVSGLSGITNVGAEFSVFSSEKEAKRAIVLSNSANTKQQSKNYYVPLEYGINTASKKIKIILKTNTQGSLESILYSIKNIPQEKIQVEMLGASSGEITENDVSLAVSTDSFIFAFNVGTNPIARNLASKHKLKIKDYTVIYDLIEDLENNMIAQLEPEYLENEIGSGEIRATFDLSRGTIAGCYVLAGKLKKDTLIKVYSKDMEIYRGNLDSIKKVKEDVTEIEAKQECGLFIEGFQDWESGNIVKSFELIEQKQKL